MSDARNEEFAVSGIPPRNDGGAEIAASGIPPRNDVGGGTRH